MTRCTKFASYCLCNEYLSLITIVFTDEKKFRYGGQDGWASYWFYVTDKPGIAQMSKDYGKYKSVMILMALSNYGILNVSRASGKMNTDQCADIVLDHVIPECTVAHGDSIQSKMWGRCQQGKFIRMDVHLLMTVTSGKQQRQNLPELSHYKSFHS
ncbi:MAG: hypothetical protein EZS28_019355 [Streblomastix strix]|uniref:Uncharacterized protein n=1 Tax=Streblomastix strix TaxID=222440 RepID=A0A5J4VR08_9EUKA|nr:MAG: hypothetical protein EZS28_019355 [Streblomastix strix]